MIRKSVKSSNVISVGYDEKEKTLEVEFTKGGVYQYYNVAYTTYERLLTSTSVGKFIHSDIRGRYRFKKL